MTGPTLTAPFRNSSELTKGGRTFTYIPAALPPTMRDRVRVSADGCWLWMGAVCRTPGFDYGRVHWEGKTRLAHRLAYTLLVGDPGPLQLDHLCRTPRCCNPSHLEPVTARENVMRGETEARRNSSKTHCKNGHPLSGENLYIDPRGKRHCRTCDRANRRRRYHEQREKYREYHREWAREYRRKKRGAS